MKRKKRNNHLFEGIFIAALLLLFPVTMYVNLQAGKHEDLGQYEKAPISSSFEVRDVETLYEDLDEVRTIYLTVGRWEDGNNAQMSWEELNAHSLSWYRENDLEPYQCDALIQFGNEEGPVSGQFGYGDVGANASIRLSGEKASERPQKSYHVNIKSEGGIEGIKSFVLLKGFSDPYRFGNKLCYELLTEMEGMLSTRTYFVHLYVRNEADKGDEGKYFVDYGLYTMVESINKKYLKNRGLESSGELYKAVDFDFGRHEDKILQPTDSTYQKDEFETILEAKGSNDYSKLLDMLDAVNQEDIPIREIVHDYFDEDNIYSWLAFNILMDNKKTDTENFYLYSPMGSEKFYFIPWDYDGVLREDYEVIKDPDYSPGWEKGIHLYTKSLLFSRMMKDQHCVDKLNETITALHESVLSPENVGKNAERLAKVVKPMLYALPDRSFARVTKENYQMLLESIPEQMDQNFYAYYDSLETPWPFHILEPKVENGHVILSWEESFLLNGSYHYSLELSESWDFKKVLVSEDKLEGNSLDVGALAPGQYFVHVTACAENGLKQEAYEHYNTEKKTTVEGVMCFYVLKDKTVAVSLF